MARPKSKGAYVPLAAQYFMDDAILEAGPEAELLFVRCISFLASVSSDGFITDRQLRTIVAINLRNVQRRLDALLAVGLLEERDGGFVARSWKKWNRSAEEINKELARDRARKAQKAAELDTNSGGNPSGTNVENVRQSSTEQSSTEQSTPPTEEVAAKRGTRIPDLFIVTRAMREWAAEKTPLVNVDAATAKFCDHWRSKSGKDATKRDWVATWRNWLRSDQERAEQRPGIKATPTERALSVVEMGRRMQAAADSEGRGISA